ncbi:hypothetical protein J7T55_010393 [Diaporthe amygdali]|uniref:uncharacterized protein n=1 Tax=Phomopsis amygdali TaxID=1214568 RepID=UPI0022FE48CE|nr:uncharacterized protein J7T55_010393 [Diaporthe amygdali]KAJ0115570.1 hypothetical protein J7T55_010393 [Diaporthe amygdali]
MAYASNVDSATYPDSSYPWTLFIPATGTVKCDIQEMGSETVHKPFRFLHLPAELRDMVYDHVLFAPSFPTNTIDNRLRNINVDAQIHTNILFANRQVFEEAKETILRAGLVFVVSRGFSPEFPRDTAVLVDQIPVFHRKYESLCFVTHRVPASPQAQRKCQKSSTVTDDYWKYTKADFMAVSVSGFGLAEMWILIGIS